MNEDIITLTTFDNAFTANVYLTKLRSAGIECFLENENSTTLVPFLAYANGNIKLQVFRRDAEKAWAIIQDAEGPDTPAPAGDHP